MLQSYYWLTTDFDCQPVPPKIYYAATLAGRYIFLHCRHHLNQAGLVVIGGRGANLPNFSV